MSLAPKVERLNACFLFLKCLYMVTVPRKIRTFAQQNGKSWTPITIAGGATFVLLEKDRLHAFAWPFLADNRLAV